MARSEPPTPSLPPVEVRPLLDGCEAHGVTWDDIQRRWSDAADPVKFPPTGEIRSRIGMCGCCCGPMLVDGFDERGVGYSHTNFMCSVCQPKGATDGA